MKSILLFYRPMILASLCFLSTHAKSNVISEYTKQNLCFIENKGQVHDQNYNKRPDVFYYGRNKSFAFHITSTGISYQLYNLMGQESASIHRIDMNWLDCNKELYFKPKVRLQETFNFFTASCPDGITDVSSYKEIGVYNVYNGIDLKYYEVNGRLKYDFIVAPRANYQQIKLKVKGASVRINEQGQLLLSTPSGTMIEEKPSVFQDGVELKASWKILEENVVTYLIEKADPNMELIIDPITRVWGTYYGDAGADYGYSCERDGTNNIYVTGKTASWINIATTGAHQVTFNGGSDAFILKLNANGVRQWCTYYGGFGNDVANSCVTNNLGEVYIAGTTQSTGSIASPSAHQTLYGGGSNDAFLTKFNSNGQRQWSTYYGGSGDDGGTSCALDAAGNVILCGYTGSSVNIATAGAQQTTLGAGPNDMMLIKFNSGGTRLWGTYYGGSNNDFANNCKTDAFGDIYIIGATQSTNNITLGAVQQSTLGGNYDACLAKFNASGILSWGTYIGGAGTEYGYSCTLDASGNIYVAGSTQSTNNIASAGAHQINIGGLSDGFLQKYNASGILIWGTYYGGVGNDNALAACLDNVGNVYLAGQTLSGNSISSVNGFQTNYAGGVYDGYWAQFNSSGLRLYSTYYGGAGDDGIYSIVCDNLNNVFITGYSSSTSNIASSLSHQPNNNGLFDAFVVKFGNCVPLNITTSASSPVCVGNALSFNASSSSTFSLNYTWVGPNSFTSSAQNPIISSAQLGNSGTYTVIVSDMGGCSETSTIVVLVSTCTGIDLIQKQDYLIISPNPTSSEAYIKSSKLEGENNLKITDTSGKIIFNDRITLINGVAKLNFDLSAGIYFVNLMNINGEQFSQKLIITK